MTTEDDFQAAIDACPEDWQTRLVFADWLEERGDPRAAGMRALGSKQRAPKMIDGPKGTAATMHHWERGVTSWDNPIERPYLLPADWYDSMSSWNLPGRRAAEDVAALVFAKLPAARRAELLNPTVPV